MEQPAPTLGATRSRHERNGALDGIRGFAALAVLFAHLVVSMGVLPYSPLGFMGVLMFFALSGYLIGDICLRAPTTWWGYRTFIRRRVRRLAPVVVALVLLGGPLMILFGAPASRVIRDGAFALTQTMAFATTVGASSMEAIRPTWSLTVEWAFYLLFPLVLIGLKRAQASARTLGRVFAGTAGVLYAGGLLLPPIAFTLLPVANLGVLFAGAALACWHRELGDRQPLADPAYTRMALVMLGILVVLPGYTAGWGWKLAVLPAAAVATLVVIHGCWVDNRAAAILRSRPLRFVGLRAYSLYLWQVPVMWFVWVGLPQLPAVVQALLAVGIMAVVVPISFELLERPVLGARVPRRAPRATALAAGD